MPRSDRPANPVTAWGAAISMLSRRDLSEGEVRSRLLAREFAETEVEETLARLRERRYLDDRSLAAAVVRTRARDRRQGPLKIRQHLSRRAIPEDLAQAALRAEFANGAELAHAARALERLPRSRAAGGRGAPHGAPDGETGAAAGGQSPEERRKTTARLLRRLVARGFSWEAARAALLDLPSPPGGPDHSSPMRDAEETP